MATRKTARPKVSVVVPIYNVEKYLRECVNSILAQSLREIEVILVDDGSSDGCAKIVDEFAAEDKRVRAVHQKNSGYSAAVNKGIRLARGEYIGIIESDDFVEPDMYESLYKDAVRKKTDVTKGGFYLYNSTLPAARQNMVYKNPGGVDLRLAPSGTFTAAEWPRIIGFHASIWSSIYKASFIKKIKIPETAGASYQDFPFMMMIMTQARRISVVRRPFVHWRNDPKQGNSTSARGRKLLLMGQNTTLGLSILRASGQYDALKEAFFAQALWANIGFFYRISWKYKREYYRILRKIFLNIKYDPDFKFIYFRTEDKLVARAIMKHSGWFLFYLSHIFGGIKRKVGKIIALFFPTYRIARHLREEVAEIEMQNELLSEQLREIERKLEH